MSIGETPAGAVHFPQEEPQEEGHGVLFVLFVR